MIMPLSARPRSTVEACVIACGLSTRESSKDGLTHRVTMELGLSLRTLVSLSTLGIARLYIGILHLPWRARRQAENVLVCFNNSCAYSRQRCASNRPCPACKANSCRTELCRSL